MFSYCCSLKENKKQRVRDFLLTMAEAITFYTCGGIQKNVLVPALQPDTVQLRVMQQQLVTRLHLTPSISFKLAASIIIAQTTHSIMPNRLNFSECKLLDNLNKVPTVLFPQLIRCARLD